MQFDKRSFAWDSMPHKGIINNNSRTTTSTSNNNSLELIYPLAIDRRFYTLFDRAAPPSLANLLLREFVYIASKKR
jgi:hypothetical protein